MAKEEIEYQHCEKCGDRCVHTICLRCWNKQLKDKIVTDNNHDPKNN